MLFVQLYWYVLICWLLHCYVVTSQQQQDTNHKKWHLHKTSPRSARRSQRKGNSISSHYHYNNDHSQSPSSISSSDFSSSNSRVYVYQSQPSPMKSSAFLPLDLSLPASAASHSGVSMALDEENVQSISTRIKKTRKARRGRGGHTEHITDKIHSMNWKEINEKLSYQKPLFDSASSSNSNSNSNSSSTSTHRTVNQTVLAVRSSHNAADIATAKAISTSQFNADPNHPQEKRAIVTFLCEGDTSVYERYLRAFAHTLRSSGYIGKIVVMYTPQFDIHTPSIQSTLKKYHIQTKQVQQLSSTRDGHRYQHMFTKLHLWNLIEYDLIAYYDVDFIFQRNPIDVFDECEKEYSLCAVKDKGMKALRPRQTPRRYFNAGFLVIRPNKATFQQLLQMKESANNYDFAEQDLLNKYYATNLWKSLPSYYNVMHIYQQKEIPEDAIAIHEKLPILMSSFPSEKYIWNQPFRRR